MAAGEATAGEAVPALQPVDKADLDAVRGFLPGKLLGRMAALLALGILALAQMGALDLALRNVLGLDLPRDPLLKFGVLGALPAAVVVAQLLVEWRARAQARRIRARTVAVADAKERHFRVGPYEAIDRAAFHRADGEHEKVMRWILAAPEGAVPLYLTGDSGTGKSSLLSAHVVPKLKEARWTVAQARAYGDPEAQLRSALAPHLPPEMRGGTATTEAPPTTRALLEEAARQVPGKDRLLVLLDQFEEFVVLHEPAAREGFATLLRDLAARPVPGLVLLLVLRSEYEVHLEELGLPPLRLGENLWKVPRFTLGAARRFLEKGRLGLEPEVVDALVAGAARLDDTLGLVRPITVNLLGHILAEGERVRPEGMDAGRLMLGYVRQAVEHPDVRHLMPRLLPHLVTEAGTKAPATEAELASRTSLKPAEARACLNILMERALARPLDARRATWELSHDFVARLVGQALGRLRADRLRRALAYAAPTLLVLTIAGTAGTVVWTKTAEDRARASLQATGIHLEEREGGALAALAVTPTVASALPQAQRAVRHFSARIVQANLFQPELLQCESGETCFPQLRVIYLQGLHGTPTPVDLAPLAKLAALQTLHLANTSVVNLTPLTGLIALRELRLANTRVADLTPLAGLTALRSLDLSYTSIADFVPLAKLTALQTLDLSYTSIADLAPLARLAALQTLDLRGSSITDLTALAGLVALQTLRLENTSIADPAPLASLVALRELHLANTSITDLRPLTKLIALQTLRLRDTRITDLAPLAGLAALRELDLRDTRTTDLAPLARFAALQTLNLRGTRVADPAPLAGLAALQTLDLSYTDVANLAPLTKLAALRELELSYTPTTDLAPLHQVELRVVHSLQRTALKLPPGATSWRFITVR